MEEKNRDEFLCEYDNYTLPPAPERDHPNRVRLRRESMEKFRRHVAEVNAQIEAKRKMGRNANADYTQKT